MNPVNTYLADHADRLDFYTQAITNAHGAHHPEVFAVRDQYVQLRADSANDRQLTDNFAQLRATTHDYAIPNDVCPVFKATYHMLAKADALNAQA